jgi:DNA invertase Pin-like site-specific DNA recombinase
MKTAVIYARYSSDSQTEQSIEGQLRVCQQFAKNNDILIVDTYIDRAMTGTNDLRPDFQKMIKDSNKKQWDYVIVYKLDRFSRNKYETTIHKHTLNNNGVKVLSAMENIPDTPEGIILESLLEGMNQYYSAELSQKVLRGLKESYLKGQFTGGCQLYGYDVVDKKNVINENEAEIVKEIFTKYSQGFTAVAIANDLKNRGIRTKTGALLDSPRIYKMIFNTKYIGKIKHGDTVYTNIYPPIIDEITWQKVQDIRNENKHAPGRKKDIYDFILSGKLFCGECNTKMVGESGTSKTGAIHYYYNCLSRRRKNSRCEFKAVPKKNLEDFVMNITWKLLSESNNIETLANLIMKKHETIFKQNNDIKSLENKRASLLKATNNLISAIEQGIITEQTKIRLKELEAQISQLDFDIEQEKQRSYTFLTKEKILKYLNSVICGDIENLQIRKEIVKTFIREIVLYNDHIIITYNFTNETLTPTTKNGIPDDIVEIKEQSEKTVLKSSQSLSKKDCIPP